ncbi:MAG: taurine dioxygenase [Rhodospirillaceae bacterium]|jgi:taurine dioxygenase|nr:taurine dioxygenase [Rhodospirillaceae bacterium]MBT4486745.1 taurine dioxygenase [Rhodospirillaceae bacterium]MBT5881469.1 taurine dioxygenase [Rhodospirillaceae bacterium]MBT6591288.1 taurine dioxygenase [Rhodospirillaceae bacterium]MBT6986132.1 taurine dioxygenase [Rhodospirillaceae bacterium]
MTIVRAVEMPQTDAVPELRIEPLSAAIGAEIHGVDLAQNIDDGLFDAIHTALMAYQVVFFREQTITAGQQLALATRFGEPAYSKKLKMYDGYDNVSLLENDGSKIVVGAVWHTDNTDYETPPWGSLLFAEVIPAIGGDTIWASMTAAYDGLSEGMKAHLDGLTALHDNANIRRLYAGSGNLRDEGVVIDEPAQHPVVRTHPVTHRKGLFVNSAYTQRIADVPDVESQHLLAMLFEHVAKPEFQVRFKWRPGSLAIWDNRCTQHYALDDYSELRRMRRVQIVGDKPF